MAKFQNNSGFRQVVVINGEKLIAHDGDVIEAHEGFIQHGFEEVNEKTPVSITTRSRKRKFADNDLLESLQSQLRELQSQIDEKDSETANKVIQEMEAVNEKVKEFEEKALTLSSDAENDVIELKELVQAQGEQITGLEGYIKKNFDMTFKRLEILKHAMQALEFEMDQFYEEDSGK